MEQVGKTFLVTSQLRRGSRKTRGKRRLLRKISGAGGENEQGMAMEAEPGKARPKIVGRERPRKALSLGRKGAGKTKGRNSVAPFWEPDTRQQPLPLLPFGPGGVGGATAVRFPVCLRSDMHYSR